MDHEFIKATKRAFSALLESARGEPKSKSQIEEISEPRYFNYINSFLIYASLIHFCFFRTKQIKLAPSEDSTSPNNSKVLYNPIDKNDFMRRLATFMISFLYSLF